MSRRNPCLRNGCSACCFETEMPLTEKDAKRLEALGHVRADFSLVDAEGTLRLRNRERGSPRPCFFLQAGRCSVYAHRPAGCRVYPFVLDVGDEVVGDEDCPHAAQFAPSAATGRELLRIVRVVERESAARVDAPSVARRRP